ncbi:MAG TPA: DNA-processing protein DprA [Candidatus Woesebacteria bacterium]|nr:DNA-processing protein DprA [Candidatus Woesebacteria bacterium]
MTSVVSPKINIVQNIQIEQNFIESILNDSLTLNTKKNWTALASVSGVGPVTFFQLLQLIQKTQNDWPSFWAGRTRFWQENLTYKKIENSIKNFTKAYTIETYWQTLIEKQIWVLAVNEADYPCLLKHVPFPPPVLFLKGKLDLNELLPIAVIGTRHMTNYGRLVTERVVPQLTANDVLVVSGFMYGVDLSAQQAAIKAQGKCVGVLGYGFDYLYPAYLANIYQEMLNCGLACFVSEYPPFVSASKGTFVRRNHIIAGMSVAVLVIEAGIKSGTQITVNYALEYGRDVLAVSGPITSPYFQGTQAMINQGACLVGSGQEVLRAVTNSRWAEMIKNQTSQRTAINSRQVSDTSSSLLVSSTNDNSALKSSILQTLETSPSSLAQLSVLLQLSNHTVQQALTSLELDGQVICREGCWSLAL